MSIQEKANRAQASLKRIAGAIELIDAEMSELFVLSDDAEVQGFLGSSHKAHLAALNSLSGQMTAIKQTKGRLSEALREHANRGDVVVYVGT